MKFVANDYSARYKYGTFILLILLSSGLLKAYFSGVYATYTDEILSAIVAKSIFDTGLPLLPSDSLYDRDPLHHYLLAIPVGLWGMDYLPIRLNSILFSIVTVFAIYALGVKVATRKVALFAALIVSFSSLFNQFALSGRMYMTYATFYTLSLYFFYGGFINGKARSKWFAIVLMSATMLSSAAGIFLAPVFIFALVIYHGMKWLKDKVIYVGGAIWLILFWIIIIYDVPGGYESFTAHSGVTQPRTINAQMSLREIVGNLYYPWRALDKVLPLSMPFFLIMTFFVIRKGELRQHFPLVALLPGLVIDSFLAYRVQYRIIIALVPLYFLTCCQFIDTLLRWIKETYPIGGGKPTLRSVTRPIKGKTCSIFTGPSRLPVITLGVYLLLFLGVIYTNKIHNPTDLWKYIYQAFGYHDSRAGENLESSYNYLRSHADQEDKIIVTTVEYALFFLGPDYDYYYLRQKIADHNNSQVFVPFSKKKEPYYGKPLIDSIEKLQHLMESSKNAIWVIADHKADTYVGFNIKEFINENFELVFDDYLRNKTRVYRWLKT